jgi:hypothetical protein
MTWLTALEAISRTRWARSITRHLGTRAVTGDVSELSAAEAVSTSTTSETFGLRVGAITGDVTGFAALVAVVTAWLATTSHTAESGASLRAISGEVAFFTAIEAASALSAHGSRSSLGSLGAITGHMTLATTSETTVTGHLYLSTISRE